MTDQDQHLLSHQDWRYGGGGVVAGVDIGGTKIAAALVDGDGGLLARAQRPTPAHDPQSVLRAVLEVLDILSDQPAWSRVVGVGIGSAGPVDISRGTVSPVNIPAWRDFPLVERVAAHPPLRGLPVTLCGDAVAMTAAEHWIGAAAGRRDALCMVVSTGVGAGLVLDGAVRTGPSGNAGHLGHITVDLDGGDCPCGSRGCLEGFASGTSITRRALEAGWRPGAEPTAEQVAVSARSGDPHALAAFDRAGQALAAGIAAVATLVEIEVAVIGGGVAEAGDVLFQPLRRHLRSYATLPFAARVDVTRAHLRGNAGLIGAAAMFAASTRAVAGPVGELI